MYIHKMQKGPTLSYEFLMFHFVYSHTLNNNIQNEFDYVIQAIHYTLVVTIRKKNHQLNMKRKEVKLQL